MHQERQRGQSVKHSLLSLGPTRVRVYPLRPSLLVLILFSLADLSGCGAPPQLINPEQLAASPAASMAEETAQSSDCSRLEGRDRFHLEHFQRLTLREGRRLAAYLQVLQLQLPPHHYFTRRGDLSALFGAQHLRALSLLEGELSSCLNEELFHAWRAQLARQLAEILSARVVTLRGDRRGVNRGEQRRELEGTEAPMDELNRP